VTNRRVETMTERVRSQLTNLHTELVRAAHVIHHGSIRWENVLARSSSLLPWCLVAPCRPCVWDLQRGPAHQIWASMLLIIATSMKGTRLGQDAARCCTSV
jgi:hypothetical protein